MCLMTYDFHSCVEFDQVWHFARVLTRIVHVYGHVRDLGSIPIKHLSLAQMVQELELDQVWHFMQVWCVSFTCTATWETWDPTHLIRHHQIPPVRLFSTHLSSSNGSRVRAWPSLTLYVHMTCVIHVYSHVRDLGHIPINQAPSNSPILTIYTFL